MSGARHEHRNMRVRSVFTRTLISALVSLAIVPGVALACSPRHDRNLDKGNRIAASLLAQGVTGAADVQRTLQRARHRCDAAMYARGLAVVLQRYGAPREGQRVRWRGIPYRGTLTAGRILWRFDTITAFRALPSDTRRSSRYRSLRTFVAFGRSPLIWSVDPVHVQPNVDVQLNVLRTLVARGIRPRDQERSIMAFRRGSLVSPWRTSPLLIATRRAIELHRIASASANKHVRMHAQRSTTMVSNRLQATPVRGWSRIDGSWSTAREHRRLMHLARQLAAARSDTHLHEVAVRLQRQSISVPRLQFLQLPGLGFYPWPADGAFDVEHATIDVDKPVTVETRIYHSSGNLVRSTTQTADPGALALSWDGRSSGGVLLSVGQYSYTVIIRDRLNNTAVVAGIGTFNILRDMRSPTIGSARVRYISGSRRRELRAAWSIDERISPRIEAEVVLIAGKDRVTIPIVDPTLSGRRTLRRRLASGSWRVVFRATDGSGNRSTRNLGMIDLP